MSVDMDHACEEPAARACAVRIPRWVVVTIGAAWAAVLLSPRDQWHHPVAHTVAGGAMVVRGLDAATFGWPIEWLSWGKPEWIVTGGKRTGAATDADIRAFVEAESVDWANFRIFCGLDQSLAARTIRQERGQLTDDPRAAVVAVSWASLRADAIAGALVPVGALLWWTWHRRRTLRRRQAEGMCVVCGYSLRGNVSGRCPECGTAVAVAGRAG